MRWRCAFLLSLSMSACPWASGQAPERLAILEGNGPFVQSNPTFATTENQVANDLAAKLTGKPGIDLVNRAKVNQTLKEQNLESSDRSSSDAVARIGKLLGVQQVVLVNVDEASTATTTGSNSKTETFRLRVSARVIDVETGEILAQPSSSYQDSVRGNSPLGNFGKQLPPPQSPANEWAKAGQAVASDLSSKLAAAFASLPFHKLPPVLIAGIIDGKVYINQGSKVGIKPGDKFQVTREVSIGLIDPGTGKTITNKQRICVFTVAVANETNSSGTCPDGSPQSKDLAEPIH